MKKGMMVFIFLCCLSMTGCIMQRRVAIKVVTDFLDKMIANDQKLESYRIYVTPGSNVLKIEYELNSKIEKAHSDYYLKKIKEYILSKDVFDKIIAEHGGKIEEVDIDFKYKTNQNIIIYRYISDSSFEEWRFQQYINRDYLKIIK